MRITIVNPPHTAIGSRIPKEHLPPLGLLSVGGSLIDTGHEVTLIDAEIGPLSLTEIVDRVQATQPDAILIGHSGSTSAHPTVCELTQRFKLVLNQVKIIYGGVFPTYHYREILEQERQIDVVVRGEAEETAPQLIQALELGTNLEHVHGIAFRRYDRVVVTPTASLIANLDSYRVGWELVDMNSYSYYGGRRAVVMQFSRGCPHQCSYCGQQDFWKKWRHRDPQKFASEIAWLHRTHGIEVFNLADENPTVSKRVWRELCEAIIAEDISITIIGSTRADDIVRDSDILYLYRKAGVERFLLGIESTNKITLDRIRKGASQSSDREAIKLLRRHGILSLVTWVTDFEEVTDRDFVASLRQLLLYDPDQIMPLYVTPHRWTAYYHEASQRRVIQMDQRCWDYKHQVLATRYMAPWRIFLWVKLVEAVLQLRPKALWRSFFHPDIALRRGMRWYTQMGRRVWPYEWIGFFLRESRLSNGPVLGKYWGESKRHQKLLIPKCFRKSKALAELQLSREQQIEAGEYQ
jgi:anaerobic magnesium-protoporphyrin IX monomethyl ester cyclase